MDHTTLLIACLTGVAAVALLLQSRTGDLSSKLALLGTTLAKLVPLIKPPVGILVCYDVFIDHDDASIPELERVGEGQEVRYAHRFVLADYGLVHFGQLTNILAEREGGTIVFRSITPIQSVRQVEGAPAGMLLDFRATQQSV